MEKQHRLKVQLSKRTFGKKDKMLKLHFKANETFFPLTNMKTLAIEIAIAISQNKTS